MKLKTKGEHIEYWATQSIDDLEASEVLYVGKKYLQALFFSHLALEKVCKACWVKDHAENTPPKTHNLIFILAQTNLEISPRQKEFLLEINRFQIEGRYPEQLTSLAKLTNATIARTIMNEAKQLQQWLLNKVQ